MASTAPKTTDEMGKMMRLATVLSLSAGVFLVIVKAIAWSFTDSLSLMSSLADSMLDVMASAVNYVAVRYALQPADDEHRFGHGKAEDLATLAQSMFISGSGLFLVIEGIKRLFSPEEVHHNFLGISIMALSLVVTFSLVLYQRHVVRHTGSTTIQADSTHYYADFLSNAAVIAALLLGHYFSWRSADPLFAIAIATYLIISSVHMGLGAFHNLMDREFTEEDRHRIEAIVLATPHVLGIHDLRTRKSGLWGFIQFHLDLPPEMPLQQAHDISDGVETTLRQTFANVEILIHQDPFQKDASQPQHH